MSGNRYVTGVRIGIDRESVPLDDGPRQVELRILIPAAARLKIRADDERQQEEPDGELAVGGIHIRVIPSGARDPLRHREGDPSPSARLRMTGSSSVIFIGSLRL